MTESSTQLLILCVAAVAVVASITCGVVGYSVVEGDNIQKLVDKGYSPIEAKCSLMTADELNRTPTCAQFNQSSRKNGSY